jgi:hypothetical protein
MNIKNKGLSDPHVKTNGNKDKYIYFYQQGTSKKKHPDAIGML